MLRKDFSIFVGTVGIGGAGIWRSSDGGQTWVVPKGSKDEMDCCALATDPQHPEVIYAGLHNGVYRSDDRGIHFYRLESPVNAFGVWSIAIDPVDPTIVFAGCRPGAIFRTRDGGERWEKRSAEFTQEGVFGGPARVLQMVIDPADDNVVWAGVEADGIRLSVDGGETWRDVSTGLTDLDVHALAISPGSPNMVLASADLEVFTTLDLGETWSAIGVRDLFALPNCRQVAVKADDPNVIFVALGGDDNSVSGTVQRSKDRGQTWEPLSFPVPPNTPLWNLAVNPADPELIVCSSHYGQVFMSEDGGTPGTRCLKSSARFALWRGRRISCVRSACQIVERPISDHFDLDFEVENEIRAYGCSSRRGGREKLGVDFVVAGEIPRILKPDRSLHDVAERASDFLESPLDVEPGLPCLVLDTPVYDETILAPGYLAR